MSFWFMGIQSQYESKLRLYRMIPKKRKDN